MLNTDMSKAYVEPGSRFIAHRSAEHAKQLVGPNGENTKLGEEFARQHKRAERGVSFNIEPKYTLDCDDETAWRSDTSHGHRRAVGPPHGHHAAQRQVLFLDWLLERQAPRGEVLGR